MNTDNSEAIGALTRIGFDFRRQAHQLQERARYYKQCYKTATDALWTERITGSRHAEFFRQQAICSYQQAHQLAVEAHRLEQRYIHCMNGIDRLNASIPPAPAAAGDSQ